MATVTSNEEPILGYKVRYWESDQPIAKAREGQLPMVLVLLAHVFSFSHTVYKYLDGGDLEAVISGLVPGKVYKLRVLAYSWGGDGKMSSPAWEFRVGEGSPSLFVSAAAEHQLHGIVCLITLLVALIRFV